jgi:hypothetical protein
VHPAVVDIDRLLSSYEKTVQAVGQIRLAEPKALDLETEARLAMAEVAEMDRLEAERAARASQARQEQIALNEHAVHGDQGVVAGPGRDQAAPGNSPGRAG